MAQKSILTAITLLLWLLADVIAANAPEYDLRPMRKTDKGNVRGFVEFPLGKRVEKYLGIPFAKPPIGDLRFQLPAQVDPWDGVIETTTLPNSCIQVRDNFFGNFTGSQMWNSNTEQNEDCLYLNVWVPHVTSPKNKKAVMVFIYGGGFIYGSSTLDIYNANILTVENDIIFVSMQYRMGALGFLTLDTTEAPGNMGLWDQLMALEWVNNNIEFFGGDRNRVTLVGESAGAVSVGLHLLCDLCSTNFQRAILQSGSPEAGWGVLPKEEMWRRSELFAENLGCRKEGDPEYMIQCLRQKNATQMPPLEYNLASGMIQFGLVPVIDGYFIREEPQQLISQNLFKKVPILLGSNSNEATFFLVYHFEEFDRHTDSLINHNEYNRILKDSFTFYPHYPHRLNDFGFDAIKSRYTNWLDANDHVEFRNSVDQAVSDFHFVCPVNRLARAYSSADLPVYYYWFDQRWSANMWPEWMGVLHADEFWFTMGHALNDSHTFTEDEKKLSRNMMRYWTNFVKEGDPNKETPSNEPSLDEWPVFRYNEQLYLNLSTRTMKSGWSWGKGPRTQHCAFWDFYLPKLLAETSDISDVEREWKAEFHEWKTRYIVDWKTQFDAFIQNYQRKSSPCNAPAATP